jgi:hypothetical protein
LKEIEQVSFYHFCTNVATNTQGHVKVAFDNALRLAAAGFCGCLARRSRAKHPQNPADASRKALSKATLT